MKIHILYNYTEGPFGGVNQFLKALRGELTSRNMHTEDPFAAHVIIYNSFFFRAPEFYSLLYAVKRRNSRCVFMHRMDGILREIRNSEESKIYDQAATAWTEIVSDGIVFQSNFSRIRQHDEGTPPSIPYRIFGNAPDNTFFFPTTQPLKGPPWKIIYTSWSNNLRKGFPSLLWLDDHLDFSKYDMTFVGNLPEGWELKNIIHIPPQASGALGALLREQHVFLGLSHNEPCSNAVTEALHSGLPALLRNSGGNPEFVTHGGVTLFDEDAEIPQKLDAICANYTALRQELSPPDITAIAQSYIEFAERLNILKKKKISPWKYYFFRKRFSSVIPFDRRTVLKEIMGLVR